MRTIILAAAVALVAPVAAVADSPAAAISPAPAIMSAGSHPGEPLFCKYYYFNGHIIRRPVCKTDRQWIRERLRNEAEVNNFQLRSLMQHP